MSFVDRLAERIGPGDRPGRRSFLGRAAMVGSAMAVAPVDFMTRPVDAQDVVLASNAVCRSYGCGGGQLCCDGYTEFCCSLTGSNRCPPGSVTGGWWKVDSSTYCSAGGDIRPRYYLDCHKTCGGCACAGGTCSGDCNGTPCGCGRRPDGSSLGCGYRKAGCTRFRYGQCNQHIGCVGPIVCRVVTCLTPWQLDPNCTRATLTDNNTRWHDAPCLHAGFSDTIDNAYYADAVQWAVNVGITTGVEGRDLFFPDRPVNRAEIVTFMWRMLDQPPAQPHYLTDNPGGTYYHKAVQWAAGEGITTGYAGTDEFRPQLNCTRGEAVTFFKRMMRNPTPSTAPEFSDVDPNAFYADAVKWAAHHGVTTGVGGTGQFQPHGLLTRAEAVTFLWRIAGNQALWHQRPPSSKVRF
ncbi:S-layer homology domain-containing protein [Actinomarinicola tropica]|uniref:Twin-arginine translocation signal domain-containing protein n=1 Tax=Actinomarinicola tropica TaxID=2789776 RepID=A0A5Q2RR94_9ACTN|nr:S-layer homology domain-containing protein [Actinomarinicola tropica]QGG96667.1 twin-arginine translocation signal domain-containing protein [Actinomarinicola tropica]